MDKLISSTKQLSILDHDNLCVDFNVYLNKIFEENGFNVRTEGDIDTPYFNGKDLCRALEFKDSKENIKTALQNVPEDCKKNLKDIINNRIEDKSDLKYNESKEIYLTEGGMYYLIFHSKSKQAKEFEKFVRTIVLPNIRKFGQQVLLDEINEQKNAIKKKDDKIDRMNYKLDKMIRYTKEIIHTNKNLEIQNKEIIQQNNETKHINKNLEIKLDSIDTFVHKELLPNRNLPPKDKAKHHQLLLYKSSDNKYKFIRGQAKYITSALNKIWPTKIIFGPDDTPNSIDFIVIIKEKGEELNDIIIQKIKHKLKKKYGQFSETRFDKYYAKNKGYEVKSNELILNNDTLEDVLAVYADLKLKQKTID